MINVRSELPEYLKSLGLIEGAEIGVWRGEFSEMLCQAGLTVYSIDPWITYKEEENQEKMDEFYDYAVRRLSVYPNSTIIKKSSMEALTYFPDESLDFVYIDGDHSFKAVAFDICEWEKKVRKGGILAGHDYSGVSCAYVPYVVNAYAKAYKRNLVVFGSRQLAVRRGDKSKSWLWVK